MDPVPVTGGDLIMQCTQPRLLLRCDGLMGRDQEVTVAVQVRIAHGERPLQVCPHEVLAQDLHGPLGDLDQQQVELGVLSGRLVDA